MPAIEVKAYAKLNLTLDVLRKRPDGYHDLKMVMQSVALSDCLRLETGTGRGVSVSTDKSFLPNDQRNLAAAAALRFQEAVGVELGGFSVDIKKEIPVCAGMAGGSADAAAVLRSLNTLTGAGLGMEALMEIGARVGSDVPYCILGGTALAEGRGEVLTPLPPLAPCVIVLCKPGFPISTPELFSRIDCARIHRRPDTAGMLAALEAGDLSGVAHRLYNVFEDALPARKAAEIAEIKDALLEHGALGASMSGSGPTVFGLFESEAPAREAYAHLAAVYRETFLTRTV